jgi:hypothetical protein
VATGPTASTLFLSGTPLVGLPKDCEECKKKIDAFVEKYPEYAEVVAKERS